MPPTLAKNKKGKLLSKILFLGKEAVAHGLGLLRNIMKQLARA